MIDITDIFDITHILPGLGGGYSAAFWLNNLGLSNQAAASTRTSIETAYDNEGALVTGETGEIMLDGGRREQNLATSLTTHSISIESGRSYQVSCEGANASTVVLAGAATGTLTNNGTDRKTFSTEKTATTGTLTLTITGTLTHLQVQDVTGRSSVVASEKLGLGVTQWYSDTNGNTESGGVVTEAPGVAIDPVPQVLMQPQRTNLMWPSNDFSVWSVTGSVEVTSAQGVAPNGINEGWKIDDQNALSYAAISRPLSGLDLAETYSVSLYVKKDNIPNSTRFCSLELSYANSQVYFTTDTGAILSQGTGLVDASIELTGDGLWWEITLVSTGKTSLTPIFYPGAGANSVASPSQTGSAVIWHNQIEPGLVATTPIETTTAAVTRDNDLIDVADYDSWLNTTEGIFIFAATHPSDLTDVGNLKYLDGFVGDNRFIRHASGSTSVISTSQSGASTAAVSTPAATEMLVAVLYSAELNAHRIGCKVSGAWVWGALKPFVSWVANPAGVLKIMSLSTDTTNIRAASNYSGLPPGTATQEEVVTWIEANAESEILKKEG